MHLIWVYISLECGSFILCITDKYVEDRVCLWVGDNAVYNSCTVSVAKFVKCIIIGDTVKNFCIFDGPILDWLGCSVLCRFKLDLYVDWLGCVLQIWAWGAASGCGPGNSGSGQHQWTHLPRSQPVVLCSSPHPGPQLHRLPPSGCWYRAHQLPGTPHRHRLGPLSTSRWHWLWWDRVTYMSLGVGYRVMFLYPAALKQAFGYMGHMQGCYYGHGTPVYHEAVVHPSWIISYNNFKFAWLCEKFSNIFSVPYALQ